MGRTTVFAIMVGTTLAAASYSTVGAQQTGATGGTATAGSSQYAAAQAKRGEGLYAEMCAACHDPAGVGPALIGKEFIMVWKTLTLAELFEKIQTQMPQSAPGTLTPQQTADVVAFILSSNHFPAGTTELATDPAAMKFPIGEPPEK